MKASFPILGLAVLGLPFSARGDADWALVPSSREARSLDSFAVPEAPTEKVVSYVGPISSPSVQGEPLPTLSFGIPAQAEKRTGAAQGPKAPQYAIPEGAHWPDSDGRIAAPPAVAREGPIAPGMRNPWEVRAHGASQRMDTVFVFGGVVAGGDGGPVGILNSHIVRLGDSLGIYRVAGILGKGLVLEAAGSYFVVPRGARTIISAAKS
jgi:hypothetical protein